MLPLHSKQVRKLTATTESSSAAKEAASLLLSGLLLLLLLLAKASKAAAAGTEHVCEGVDKCVLGRRRAGRAAEYRRRRVAFEELDGVRVTALLLGCLARLLY